MILAIHAGTLSAWTSCKNQKKPNRWLAMTTHEGDFGAGSSSCRRRLLGNLVGGALLVLPNSQVMAVERAVGSAEKDCREAGNCLEKGDWDGAVGWSWGGKDRCDATDRRCGVDGQLMDAPPTGEPVPPLVGKITHEVELLLSIGRGESGTIRLGLYGQDCPASVEQAVNFLSTKGIVTTSRLMFENGIGVSSAPVSLINGGILNAIVPNQRLDFGIPSQAAAYARSRGKAKAGEDFVPQPRPKSLSDESSVRTHDMAGLVSVPSSGLGYGGSGRESEDEAFASGKGEILVFCANQ